LKKRSHMIAVIVLVLLISSTVSFANIASTLEGHWAEKLIDSNFVNTHFSYLDIETFDPNEYITRTDFINSFNSVMDDSDKEELVLKIEDNIANSLLTRKEAVILMVKAIETIKEIQLDETDTTIFNDLSELSEEEKLYILKANKLEIVNGYNNNTFKPNENVSQIQAIILLQRLKGELDMKTIEIPFKVVGNESSYSGKTEAANVQDKDDKVLVTITKQFSTSGYSMNINKIEKTDKGLYTIYLNIKTPDPNAITLQVINYKSVTVEIDKSTLGEEAYKFEVIDEGIDDIKLKSVR